ncbi:MAG: AAA+ family ATPase [Paracoccus sp.]|nr:AAA+ family ATPase [Paracoccus sp. (in: a-proteobacteria)]
MRHLALALTLALISGPALAQEAEPPGFFERGLGAIMDQLFGGEEPAPLADALRGMGPVLQDLAAQVDDLRHYHAPERQPNGDILIRRREGAPPPPPLGETLQPDPDQPQIAL